MTFYVCLSKSHSSVERAALIGGVKMRKVPTDSSYAVRGEALKKMVDEDKAAGLIPFYVRRRRSICPTDTELTHEYRHIQKQKPCHKNMFAKHVKSTWHIAFIICFYIHTRKSLFEPSSYYFSYLCMFVFCSSVQPLAPPLRVHLIASSSWVQYVS